VIEDYPEDVGGHSYWIAGETCQGRMVHVCCSPKASYLTVITVYQPDPQKWDVILRQRRR